MYIRRPIRRETLQRRRVAFMTVQTDESLAETYWNILSDK